MPRVILDPGAAADLPEHLDVVGRAHTQPLRLQQLALPLQLGQPLGQLGLDAGDGPRHPLRPGHVVGGGEDVQLVVLADDFPGQRVQRHQPLDLVAEHLDPDGEFLVHRDDLDGVTADPERAAGEGQVVPVVLHADQLAEQLVPLDRVTQLDLEHPVHVLLRRAQAVDARHGGHDDGVPPGEQRVGGGVPEPLDLGVDGRVFLGLVVVVVGDEVLDRVVGQHLAQFVGELGGESLVRQHDEHRPLQPLRDPGHRGGLAGAGGAEQDRVHVPGLDPPLDVGDGRRLIAGRDHVGDDLERRDLALQIGNRAHEPDLLNLRGFNCRPGVRHSERIIARRGPGVPARTRPRRPGGPGRPASRNCRSRCRRRPAAAPGWLGPPSGPGPAPRPCRAA